MAPFFGDLSQSKKLSEINTPLKAKEESLGPIQEVLDQLEQRLNGNDFICGPDYSLADCLYTCLLARLSMIDLLKEQIANRPKLAIWWGKVQIICWHRGSGFNGNNGQKVLHNPLDFFFTSKFFF